MPVSASLEFSLAFIWFSLGFFFLFFLKKFFCFRWGLRAEGRDLG